MPITTDTRSHCDNILQQSKKVVPFSEGFNGLVRTLLPEHRDLMAALESADESKVIGYLASTHLSMKWALADANHIGKMIETDNADKLFIEACTVRAVGILQLRCLDAKKQSA